MLEVNALAETLREQRLGALEATALLRTRHGGDRRRGLRLRRRRHGCGWSTARASALLGQPRRAPAGQRRRASSASAALPRRRRAPRRRGLAFPGGAGRWEVRRGDVPAGRPAPSPPRALRRQPRRCARRSAQAWQRLIRVLGHELNNSLAPIKSIAGSLDALDRARPAARRLADEDVRRGLAVIAARAEALGRFMGAYARLARLPGPASAPTSRSSPSCARVAGLETRLPVSWWPGGPASRVRADPRSARAAAHQPGAQRRRCRARDGRRRRASAGTRRRAAASSRCGSRTRAGPREHRQPVRAVLHDQARRLRHRPRAVAPDRRGARRHPHAREPHGRAAAAAPRCGCRGAPRARPPPHRRPPAPEPGAPTVGPIDRRRSAA